MNPTPDEPDNMPVDGTPTVPSPAPTAPAPFPESTPEADLAALQAIEALEAEDTVIAELEPETPIAYPEPLPAQPQQPVQAPVTIDPTLQPVIDETPAAFSTEEPTIPVPVAVAAVMTDKQEAPLPPAETIKPKKSYKKLIILLVLVIILIAVAIGGYIAVQAMEPAGTPAMVEETTITQPAGNVEAQVLQN